MNVNNFAQKTNFIAGSSDLELLPFYLSSLNIPGINLAHVEIGGRTGTRLGLTADTLTYNDLSFEINIDEDFKTYFEFTDKIFKNINPTSGQFQQVEFDFWIEINNNKGNKLFRIDFFNCKVASIGDIEMDSTDDVTNHKMSVELKYDYHITDRMQNGISKPSIPNA